MEEIQIHATFEYDQSSGVGFEYNVKALVWGGNSMGDSHIELAGPAILGIPIHREHVLYPGFWHLCCRASKEVKASLDQSGFGVVAFLISAWFVC